MKNQGKVLAVCLSDKKGIPKKDVKECQVTAQGLKDDAHAGDWHRQVSLLAIESVNKMRSLGIIANYGTFAENLTTEGLELYTLPLHTRFIINDVILELTQIGKECHAGCAIQQQTGKCIMPKEGIFTKVIQTGTIRAGDKITILLPSKNEI